MLDTLEYADKLIEVGTPELQARVHAYRLAEVLKDEVATKDDIVLVRKDMELLKSDLESQIKEVKSDLEGQIKEVKSDLEGQIKDTKMSLVQWMVGLSFAQIAMIFAMLAFMQDMFTAS